VILAIQRILRENKNKHVLSASFVIDVVICIPCLVISHCAISVIKVVLLEESLPHYRKPIIHLFFLIIVNFTMQILKRMEIQILLTRKYYGGSRILSYSRASRFYLFI